jgi:alpha-N-arabinofuranosidase
VETKNGEWVAVFLACQPYRDNFYNTGRQTFFNTVDWSGEWPIILEKGKAIPEEVQSPLTAETGKTSFSDYSGNWRDDFEEETLKMEWNFIRTPAAKWYTLEKGKLLINARKVNIAEVGNPSFIGRRMQFMNTQFTTSLKLEKDKLMEAGIVAFQNEKFFYKLTMIQEAEKSYLLVTSADKEYVKTEIEKYKPGKEIFLRMRIVGGDLICEYSLNSKTWIQAGEPLDATLLSTRVAGGFVGTYLGLYTYSQEQAIAEFDWAEHLKITY